MSIVVTELQEDYTSAKVHQGKGDYLITSTLGYKSAWCQATIQDNSILVQHWSIRLITPLNFAFDGRFFINIGESQITDSTYWIIGLLHHENVSAIVRFKSEPNGIALRETEENYKANLYYSEYSQSSLTHYLYRERITIDFNSEGRLTTSIGLNCGTTIVVNFNLIVVSCPSPSSSTNSIISIYKESNLAFIHTQIYSANSNSIGGSISIVSSQYYVSALVLQV